MSILKAQFKDEAGYYTMTWSYNPELWSVKDLLSYECKESNAELIKILSK